MLTDAQKLDVRRWLGYATLNAGEPDPVYTVNWPSTSVTLTAKLEALTATEEAALADRFLTPLAALEAGVLATADAMDTKIAGPWEANLNAASDKSRLYDNWRRDMGAFLGFAPGPALGGSGSMGGGLRLDRC